MKKTICVDFDGVLHTYDKGYDNGKIYGDLVVGAKETLELLHCKFRIVILTTRLNPMFDAENEKSKRDMRLDIRWWLAKKGIAEGTHYDELTNNKPPAIAYIDDRGIRFTNWVDVRKYFI